MLGWLFPRPPVPPWERAWTEYRFGWLIEHFGIERVRNTTVILPDDNFFPEAFARRPEDAEAILRRLCKFMEVPRANVGFEVLPDDDMPSAAGHYDRTDPGGRPIIRLAYSQLADPESVVATLAHELAHEILLGGGLLTGEESDHEWLTDLLPVFLGLGIFTANATIREAYHHAGAVSWWTMNRTGYLPSHVIGYALAIFCWLRGERRPTWTRELRLDARAALRGGLRYIRRTRDCALAPEELHEPQPPSREETLMALRQGTPSARIRAMWALESYDEATVALLVELLRHRESDVSRVALRALRDAGSANPQMAAAVLDRLRDWNESVRAEAATTAAHFQLDPDAFSPALAMLLTESCRDVARAAAVALASYGAKANVRNRDILAALHDALIACDCVMIDALVSVLRETSDDPGLAINEYFRQRDTEFRQMAIDALYAHDDSGIIHTDDL